MKTSIELKNIRLYAYHGCMPEETIIGSDYRVDVWVYGDFRKASLSDALNDAVDYVHINKIVEEEMSKASKLIEHVAYRIAQHLFEAFPNIDKTKVKVSKISPPINGDVEKVSSILKVKRDEI